MCNTLIEPTGAPARWEGRFRSCLTQEEQYLLACQRYIELNPVRAGMVEHLRSIRGQVTAPTPRAKPIR